jgi:hypothetical protein
MLRILLICSVASLLGACSTLNTPHYDWATAGLACADIGIAPGSGRFNQCVANLYYSLWDLQHPSDG